MSQLFGKQKLITLLNVNMFKCQKNVYLSLSKELVKEVLGESLKADVLSAIVITDKIVQKFEELMESTNVEEFIFCFD